MNKRPETNPDPCIENGPRFVWPSLLFAVSTTRRAPRPQRGIQGVTEEKPSESTMKCAQSNLPQSRSTHALPGNARKRGDSQHHRSCTVCGRLRKPWAMVRFGQLTLIVAAILDMAAILSHSIRSQARRLPNPPIQLETGSRRRSALRTSSPKRSDPS